MYAKRYSRTKSRIGPLYKKNKKLFTNNSKEMANLLQNQYESVFTKPDHSNIDQAGDAVDS